MVWDSYAVCRLTTHVLWIMLVDIMCVCVMCTLARVHTLMCSSFLFRVLSAPPRPLTARCLCFDLCCSFFSPLGSCGIWLNYNLWQVDVHIAQHRATQRQRKKKCSTKITLYLPCQTTNVFIPFKMSLFFFEASHIYCKQNRISFVCVTCVCGIALEPLSSPYHIKIFSNTTSAGLTHIFPYVIMVKCNVSECEWMLVVQ